MGFDKFYETEYGVNPQLWHSYRPILKDLIQNIDRYS